MSMNLIVEYSSQGPKIIQMKYQIKIQQIPFKKEARASKDWNECHHRNCQNRANENVRLEIPAVIQ